MLSDIELTILSLVAEGARYGEEIEQIIERRGLREWLTVGSASVYYVLARLAQQELIARTPPEPAANDSHPPRVVYQITDAGRGVVQTAVADLLSEPRPLGGGFTLGLANIGVIKPRQVYRALIQHQDRLAQQLEAAESLWARRLRDETPSEGVAALYTHGIAVMRAELDWLGTFITGWRDRYPAVEREETGEHPSAAPTQISRSTRDLDAGKKIQRIKRPPDRSGAE